MNPDLLAAALDGRRLEELTKAEQQALAIQIMDEVIVPLIAAALDGRHRPPLRLIQGEAS